MSDRDPLQFYPTPTHIALRMWGAFEVSASRKNRFLEPSAGDGALIDVRPRNFQHANVDAIEIDPMRQATLRGRFPKLRIIGHDFLQFTRGAGYAGIILNPPFQNGAAHVLHAWDILWDGEVVALLNSETLDNPCTAERVRLVQLIERYGNIVERIPDAFSDAERKAQVDCVIVRLRKKAEADIVGNVIGELRSDSATPNMDIPADLNALALPDNELENAVFAFEAAVQTSQEAIRSRVRASHYIGILGRTRSEEMEGRSAPADPLKNVQELFAEEYEELKDRAWNRILNTSQIRSRLSLHAQKRLEAEFETIRQLDFTYENVFGFLVGLVQNQGELQFETLEYAFDAFSRYSLGNVHYFRSWKSNGKHRSLGMKLKATRFITPARAHGFYSKSLSYDDERFLSEIDKAFALLDSKQAPEFSLVEASQQHYQELLSGERISSTYFDMRYYGGRGTIHLFPRRKDLVERLNRLIGARRRWIPAESSAADVGSDFWSQYENAEKHHQAFVAKARVMSGRSYACDDVIWRLHNAPHHQDDDVDFANEKALAAFRDVHEAAGLNVDLALDCGSDNAYMEALAS